MKVTNPKSKAYEAIISELIKQFELMYTVGGNTPTTSIPTRINCGDCFVMALLVEQIASSKGLTPQIYAGGWHVFVVDDGLIYDAYFPSGVSKEELKGMQTYNPKDDLPFYHGSYIGSYNYLNTYFYNVPSRGLFINYLLNHYGLKMPIGLRNCIQRFKPAKNGRRALRDINAMRRTINKLRILNG